MLRVLTSRPRAVSALATRSEGPLAVSPAPGAGPVHFRVTIDGAAPGNSHGADVDADGQGVVDRQRLYQLVRQTGPIVDRTFEMHFFEPGVQAFAFTFG